MSEDHLLILRKRALDNATLDSHVRTLQASLVLDAYQLRMNLRGYGLAFLKKGPADKLAEQGQRLGDLGYQWCVTPQLPQRPEPNVVTRFEIREKEIRFFGKNGDGEIKKGAKVLAILAGTRGGFAAKIIRKASFQGVKKVSFSDQEKFRLILQNEPVLDIYVLPDHLENAAAVLSAPFRILPGRFDPNSLGELAGLGTTQNMEAFLKVLRGVSGALFLEMDYGMFSLPRLPFDTADTPEAAERNRLHVTVYGWYLLHLYAQSPQEKQSPKKVMNPISPLLAAMGVPSDNKEPLPFEKPPEQDDDFLPAPPMESYGERKKAFSFGQRFQIATGASWVVVLLAFAIFALNPSNILASFFFQKSLIFIILAGIFFYGGFYFLRLNRWMDMTPTSKIRSMAMGMVEVKGTCYRAYNLLSPVSFTPCIYYRIQRYKKRQTRNEQWTKVSDRESDGVPFYLADGTGKVLVEPYGATVKSSHSQTITGSFSSNLSPHIQVMDDEKIVETTIPEGVTLYVLGFASPRKEKNVSLGQKVAQALKRIKSDSSQMTFYDKNKDGVIDEQEWDVARRDVEKRVLEKDLAQYREIKSSDSAVILKPKYRGLPFIISESSERRMGRKNLFFAAALFVGSVAIGILGVVLLVQ